LAGTNVHQIVERLLSISDEDLLTIDRKYRDPWSGKLFSRFLILSNELLVVRLVLLTRSRKF
jgi:putative DNA primase/helicase